VRWTSAVAVVVNLVVATTAPAQPATVARHYLESSMGHSADLVRSRVGRPLSVDATEIILSNGQRAPAERWWYRCGDNSVPTGYRWAFLTL
jgi:hypothetical protein